MASSKLANQMNRSLETKLAIYENMERNVGQRPVIFTSRAEIWSTDTNPVIITGHPFPFVSLNNDNPNPGDLTKEMMAYFRNLPTVKEQEHRLLNLILFEFQVRGGTEVHAVFSRRKSSAEEIPERIYLKDLYPADVLIRQHLTGTDEEKISKSCLLMVLAGGSVMHQTRFSGDIRRFEVTTTSKEDRNLDIGLIKSRLGSELYRNLKRKLLLFHLGHKAGANGVTFTSVPYLWGSEIPMMVIKDPLPRTSVDYNYEFFDIEQDIIDYVTYRARRTKTAPFYAYSRRFGDVQFADVHLLFARNDILSPSVTLAPSLSRLSSDSDLSGPTVPPRRQATMEHRWSSRPVAKADVDEFASDDSSQLSSDSARSGHLTMSHNLVPGEYRSYGSPMTGVPETFVKRQVRVEQNGMSLTSSFDALRSDNVHKDDARRSSSSSSSSSTLGRWSLETEDTGEYDNDEEMRSIARRLGCVLMRNLDEILRVYASRSEVAKYWAYIFTDDRRIWREEWDPVITIIDRLPIPPLYNHKENDIIEDIVDYLCLSYLREKAEDSEPVYVSTLWFGTGSDTEVHILMSQHQETAMQYYFHAELSPTLNPPSSRVHSLPEVSAPETSAGPGATSLTKHTRSVPAARKSKDNLDNLPDIPEGCLFPRNPEEYVP